LTKLQNLLNIQAASTAFIIVWAINEALLANISQKQLPQAWWIIKLLSAFGIYTFVYQTISYYIHSRFALKASKEGKILGQWYQIFQINNYNSTNTNDHIRFGIVSISFHNESLEISAKSNKSSDKSSNSHWYSDQVTLQGQKLWLIFTSSGPGRGSTLGTMELHFQGDEPKTMSGIFHDASPSKHFGNMELYRSEDDFNKRLDELMSNESH